jgi:hypothetical protein
MGNGAAIIVAQIKQEHLDVVRVMTGENITQQHAGGVETEARAQVTHPQACRDRTCGWLREGCRCELLADSGAQCELVVAGQGRATLRKARLMRSPRPG